MSASLDRSGSRSRNSSPDELNLLKKQLQQQENDFKREKAILSHKIELLTIQLKDSQEREETAKRLHETMLSVFNTEKGIDHLANSEEIYKLINEYGKK